MLPKRIAPLPAAIGATALAAILQGLIFRWIAVRLDRWPPYDAHLLTARLFAGCASNAACMHAAGTLSFAVFAVAVALIAARNADRPWLAALLAGVATAISPLASVILVHPFGAESFAALLLFAALLADAAGSLPLPLPAQCALAAALVLDAPLFLLSVFAYAVVAALRSRTWPSALAVAVSGAIAAALSLYFSGWFAAFGQHPLAGEGTNLTLIACAFLLCIATPAVVAFTREGHSSRIGFASGNGALYAIGVAALLQGLFASGNSPATSWLAAQAAVLIAILRAPRARTAAASIVLAAAIALDLTQTFALAHSGSFMAAAGVPRNVQTLSAALADAHDRRTSICVSGESSAAAGRTVQTFYGAVHPVREPVQCLERAFANGYVITLDGENATNWGTGANALMRAALLQRKRHIALARGSASGRGVSFTTALTPLGPVPAFIVQSGFSYTISCAWTGTGRHLAFASGNPLQAYPGATPVQYTVSTIVAGRQRVLVQHEVDPHGEPLDWAFDNVALPAQKHCGSLTFSAIALAPQAIGTWSEFVSPVLR